jgi:hypothetical protein
MISILCASPFAAAVFPRSLLAVELQVVTMPAMNIASIVSQLKQERDRLDNAIRALEGTRNNGRPRGSAKRTISASALRRIREAQKKRWAAWRAKQKSKS